MLERLVRQRSKKHVSLWWAQRDGRGLAGAMVIESPGKTGMLLHTPTAEATEIPPLTELTRAISLDGLQRGLSLVQAIEDPEAKADTEMLLAAGFDSLARMIYMRCEVNGPPDEEIDAALTWRNYEEFTESELGDVIARTYAGSLDCPRLNGVRELEDIIAGYKGNGVFRPQSWWLVERGSQTTGCVLLNDAMSPGIAEIVYMGVLPEHRGCGIGRAMLHRAASCAHQRGIKIITVAVDAANRYAARLYKSQGYRENHCRLGYIMDRKSMHSRDESTAV